MILLLAVMVLQVAPWILFYQGGGGGRGRRAYGWLALEGGGLMDGWP